MKKNENNWKLQTLPFGDEMKNALQQQHHAAQYLALVGRHLIPQQPDDRNTNMEFIPETGMLVGNSLSNGMKIGLQLSNLKLVILDATNRSLKTISLNGKTKKQGFVELKRNLSALGIDTTSFTNQLHYEIPRNALDEGAVFSVKHEKFFIENMIYRNNAKGILTEIALEIKNASAVKIWPHHFDTGSFVSFSKNEKGEVSQTIGLGLAIPDSMVSVPYFYLSFWSEKQKKDPVDFPSLESGKWMMPVWNGAILDVSEIVKASSANKQYQMVKSFFISGMNTVTSYLRNN